MNHLKTKLLSHAPVYGPTCTLGSVESVEIACHAGFDFVFVDGQHGQFNRDQMREVVRAVQTTDVTPVARPSASSDPGQIEFLLDVGYPALMIPMVNTAEHARRLVDAAYFPPLGHRSTGASRSPLYFGKHYHERFNDQLLLMVFIEHIDGVENVEEIASVPGISGCFIGTNDLAVSRGITMDVPGGVGPEEHEQAIEKVRKATEAAGKIPGIHTPDAKMAHCRVAQGFRLIAVDYEHNMIATSYKHIVAELSEADQFDFTQCGNLHYANKVNDG